jgi:hypothetical protein
MTTHATLCALRGRTRLAESSSVTEVMFVNWYALTMRKLASTSTAAKSAKWCTGRESAKGEAPARRAARTRSPP